MSVWANVGAHFAGYQGARAEDSGGSTIDETHEERLDRLYRQVMQYEP